MRPHSKTIASAMSFIALGSAGIAESQESARVNLPAQTQVDGTNFEG